MCAAFHAQAKGLTLHVSRNSATGYKGVYKMKNLFRAQYSTGARGVPKRAALAAR